MTGCIKQGEIIELSDGRRRAIVLSRSLFNETGLCVACPVVENASEDPLHVKIHSDRMAGVALCEQLKTLDMRKRHYRSLGEVSYIQIQELSDIMQSIFEYYPYGV